MLSLILLTWILSLDVLGQIPEGFVFIKGAEYEGGRIRIEDFEMLDHTVTIGKTDKSRLARKSTLLFLSIAMMSDSTCNGSQIRMGGCTGCQQAWSLDMQPTVAWTVLTIHGVMINQQIRLITTHADHGD